MSLLLDALRRAEESRRAKEAGSDAVQSSGAAVAADHARTQPPIPALLPTPPHSLALDDEPVMKPARSRSSEATEMAPFTAFQSGLSLEELTTPEIAPDPSPSPSPEIAPAKNAVDIPVENAQREVARNVFASKLLNPHPVGAKNSRKWLMPVVAGIAIIVGAGGWYVWNEINGLSRPAMARITTPPVPLPMAALTTGQVGIKLEPAEVIVVKAAEAPAPLPAPLPPLLPPPAIESPLLTVPANSPTERALTARETLARKLKDAPVAKEAIVGLKLAQTIASPKPNTELTMAYQSLVGGDYALAQKQYAKLVLSEPLNVDAHLGMATAAARDGDTAAATRHYRQVLVLDPRNGLAIMGLVALSEGAQPASLEIELKTLIGRNPDAAPLHFALGNLYASGKRWTEAQQAYFEAFRIDAVNPDYLFNLAVSLDQLRQSRLALDYYRRAEAVVLAKGGGQFDRNTIAKRIAELSGDAARSK